MRPHLEYANVVWGSTFTTDLNIIESVWPCDDIQVLYSVGITVETGSGHSDDLGQLEYFSPNLLTALLESVYNFT